MKNNLEKVIKGCFKRRVSMTLAALTVFAITGSMGYAALTEEFQAKDFVEEEPIYILGISSGKTRKLAAPGLIMVEVGKTNKQVNTNTADIATVKTTVNEAKTAAERAEQTASATSGRLDKVEDTVETHGMAIKALKNNKAD